MKRLTPCCLAASIKFFCPSTVTSLLPTADTITSTYAQVRRRVSPFIKSPSTIPALFAFISAIFWRFSWWLSLLDRTIALTSTVPLSSTAATIKEPRIRVEPTNQNGQFCSPDFPCKVSCKVYRFITKAHAWIASFPAKGNSKSKGGLGACLNFR